MKKNKTKKIGRNSLAIVQSFFPKVKEIVDATKPLYAEVTDKDVVISERRDHRVCALAIACKRLTHADGVIIGLTTCYIVIGSTATRYKLSGTTSREITAFDRKAIFAAGLYKLNPACESQRLGAHKGHKPHPKIKNGSTLKNFRHFTSGVRTVLGQYVPPGVAGK